MNLTQGPLQIRVFQHLFCLLHVKKYKFSLILFLLVFFNAIGPEVQAKETNFPLYPFIAENVSFWEKIYSTHSVNTAVLHDKNNLGIVYAEISLRAGDSRQIKKLNKRKIDAAKQKYKKILLRLSRGEPARFGAIKRVKNLFPENVSKQSFVTAAENMRVQRGLKERFIEGVIRSGAYMQEIKSIFYSMNLPTDLAYLPHVESSFNLKAHSKKGASGIWQFTRGTGKQYMEINDAVDERRDPILSARAAAEFLRDNYLALGNWPMAVTAYNYGKAGMMRAKKEKGTYENIFTSYKKGHFKFASRNFYPEFLAAVYVAKKLERSEQHRLDRPVKTISVNLPAYALAPELCQHLRISGALMKEYNPALLATVYRGEKYIPPSYQLKLPALQIPASRLKNMPKHLFADSQKRSMTYKVQRGDTASKIALQHRVTLGQLIARNNLDARARVYIGQVLKIPQVNKKKSGRPVMTIRARQNKRLIMARSV